MVNAQAVPSTIWELELQILGTHAGLNELESGAAGQQSVLTSPSGDSEACSNLKTTPPGLPYTHSSPHRNVMLQVPKSTTSLGTGRELIARPSPVTVRFLLPHTRFQPLSMPLPPVLLYPHRARPRSSASLPQCQRGRGAGREAHCSRTQE